MNKFVQKPIRRAAIVLLAVILTGFIFAESSWADNVVTSNLKTTPLSIVRPGGTIKFRATVFNVPAFPVQPGGIVRCWVTRHDFSWISEKKDIQYPGTGTVNVNFTKGFTVPSDAKSGDVFDFYLVYGIWYPISEKASVKVLLLRQKKTTLQLKEIPKVKKNLKKVPSVKKRAVE
jgi:hypothetical protein